MDAQLAVPVPRNEPVHEYRPGSPERASLEARIADLRKADPDLTTTIGGVQRMASGPAIEVVQPHAVRSVLGNSANATRADGERAVAAAKEAAPGWRALPFAERAAVFLRAAELLAGGWRDTLNAATILGQSKSCYQAEIDAACELIDFLRFNAPRRGPTSRGVSGRVAAFATALRLRSLRLCTAIRPTFPYSAAP